MRLAAKAASEVAVRTMLCIVPIWFSVRKRPNRIPHKFPFAQGREEEILRNDALFILT
jgi:hypothetical protein